MCPPLLQCERSLGQGDGRLSKRSVSRTSRTCLQKTLEVEVSSRSERRMQQMLGMAESCWRYRERNAVDKTCNREGGSRNEARAVVQATVQSDQHAAMHESRLRERFLWQEDCPLAWCTCGRIATCNTHAAACNCSVGATFAQVCCVGMQVYQPAAHHTY